MRGRVCAAAILALMPQCGVLHAAETVVPDGKGGRIRVIAPDVIAVPPVDPSALKRVEPRAPLGDLGMAARPAPQKRDAGKPRVSILIRPKRPPLIHNPVALSAGRIEAQGKVIAIEGIEELPADAQCAGKPCGMIARTAFRNWLRGRAMACELPEEGMGGAKAETDGQDNAITAPCSVGGEDVAYWLAVHGWIFKATAKDPEGGVEEARSSGAGLYGLGFTGVDAAEGDTAKPADGG